MLEIEYSSELKYQIETNCDNHNDGFAELEYFKNSTGTFVHLFAATVAFEEFWKNDEGQKFFSEIVGYNITVTFNGDSSLIQRFVAAASLFFELNNAVKTGEKLYLIKKDFHS